MKSDQILTVEPGYKSLTLVTAPPYHITPACLLLGIPDLISPPADLIYRPPTLPVGCPTLLASDCLTLPRLEAAIALLLLPLEEPNMTPAASCHHTYTTATTLPSAVLCVSVCACVSVYVCWFSFIKQVMYLLLHSAACFFAPFCHVLMCVCEALSPCGLTSASIWQ